MDTQTFSLQVNQELKHDRKYKKCLESYSNFSNFNESYIEKLRYFILNGENYNIDRITENVKRYFFDECIPSVVNSHYENFNKIEFMFTQAFRIKLSDKVQDEINNNYFKDEMKKLINDSYLNYPLEFNKFNENDFFYNNKYELRNINTNLFAESERGSKGIFLLIF